jgi:hypothetical protein
MPEQDFETGEMDQAEEVFDMSSFAMNCSANIWLPSGANTS